MAQFVAEITAKINDFVSKMDEVVKKADETGARLQDIGGKMSLFVTAPLTALGAAALNSFGKIESLKNGLEALTGSSAETNKQLERLKELTNIPGLDLESLVKGTINLQTIGWTAENAEKAMAGLGNAIALIGGGQEDFKGALYGLQQLANTEFPLGEDLNILKERLPQITPLLKDAFGASRSEDLQKLKVTSQQVIDAIVTGLNKLPKAAVGLDGSFTSLRNSISMATAELGEVINEAFDVTGMINKLSNAVKDLSSWFKGLDRDTQRVIVIVGGITAAIGPFLVALGSIIRIAPLVGTAVTFMTGPIGIVVTVIAAAAIAIIANLDKVRKFLSSTIEAVANFSNKLGLTGVGKSLQGAADWVKPATAAVQDFNKSNEEYSAIADKAINKTTKTKTEVSGLGTETNKAAKNTRDFKRDLTDALGSMGYYDSAIASITYKFKDLTKLAQQAGASAKDLGRIAREELGEKLSLALGQSANIDPTKNVSLSGIFTMDEGAISEQMNVASKIITDKVNSLKTDFSNFTLDIGAMLGEMTISAMSSLGEALASGTNVINAIGKSLVSTLGGIASTVGKQMIALGTAGIALKKLVLNPFLAIAAGAALVALGSYASSAVNKTVNSGGVGSGGYSQSSVSSSVVGGGMNTGPLYNNDRQVVEFKIRNTELTAAINLNQNRNNRLS